MTESFSRTVEVEGLHNLRDVGGYRAGDQTTRWRRLLRSDAPHQLTERGQQQFDALEIATVIDLRDDLERRFAPSQLVGRTSVVENPIFQGVDTTINDPDFGLEDFYRYLIDHHGENYVSALRVIAASNQQPVLVHCTAGKDRTGTVVAFALTAVGVDRDDILHDYAQTESLLAREWAEQHVALMQQHGLTITPKLRRLLVASPVEALDDTLHHIDRTHGSVRDYLSAHGLHENDLNALATLLLSD